MTKRDRQREYWRRWYKKNRTKVLKANRQWRKDNWERHLRTTRTYRAKNRQRQRVLSRRWSYGLTDDAFKRMKEAQNNRCALCNRKVKLVVDHCHHTGRIRGLLCYRCNTGLGFLGDTPDSLDRAFKYVRG